MRKYFTLLIVLTAVSTYAYVPQPGSPLAEGTHPRLHITQDDLPDLRRLLSSSYRSIYQDYVNWAASANDNDEYNVLFEAGHDPLRALMVHQAYIAAVGQVSGISYPISLERYAERAINRLMNRLNAGDHLSYVAALTYDWTYNYMTDEQRQQIANQMRTREITHKVFDHSLANPVIQPEQMFSSKYFECFYAYYLGLAFWGDGLIDADADRAVDTFYDVMLNFGYLDAQNFTAADGGGWGEWIGYSSWHPRTHMLNVDAWRTATGEDYVRNKGQVDGNALRSYPRFMVYAMDPHKYFDRHYMYVRMGLAETTDPSLEHRSMREQIYLVSGLLKDSGLDEEAGLARHVIDHYEVAWPSYEHFYLWGFLSEHQSVTPVTPEELNLPKSHWSPRLGAFFTRTGFSSKADGVFQVTDGHYHFDGHQGVDDFPGFGLLKFGTLVNTRCVAHRGYGNLDNYPGGHSDNIVVFDGDYTVDRSSMDTPAELKSAYEGDPDYDYGGIEQITRRNEKFYHVRVNRDRHFQAGVSHTREFVWLPGANPAIDSDILVTYDRTSAPTQPTWTYHVPWKPQAFNYSQSEDITTGSSTSDRIGDAYTGTEIIIKELNSIGGENDGDDGTSDYVGGAGAHGVAFVKTLLPRQSRVEVTRVAEMDDQVMKRQHHLAIKSHRWQVSVKPELNATEHRFLNVFQTADANRVNTMMNMELIEVGTVMQGVWIERENNSRPNYVVLFNRLSGIAHNTVTYAVQGQGETRHVITGLEPYTIYEISDISGTIEKFEQVSENDMQLWDYQGITQNVATGVLYFESNLSGNHTFLINKSGEQDFTPPSQPGGLRIVPND